MYIAAPGTYHGKPYLYGVDSDAGKFVFWSDDMDNYIVNEHIGDETIMNVDGAEYHKIHLDKYDQTRESIYANSTNDSFVLDKQYIFNETRQPFSITSWYDSSYEEGDGWHEGDARTFLEEETFVAKGTNKQSQSLSADKQVVWGPNGDMWVWKNNYNVSAYVNNFMPCGVYESVEHGTDIEIGNRTWQMNGPGTDSPTLKIVKKTEQENGHNVYQLMTFDDSPKFGQYNGPYSHIISEMKYDGGVIKCTITMDYIRPEMGAVPVTLSFVEPSSFSDFTVNYTSEAGSGQLTATVWGLSFPVENKKHLNGKKILLFQNAIYK